MDSPAHGKLSENLSKKPQVLITDAGSYLGVSVAESLLLQNCDVFAVGSSPLITKLLSNQNLTLLELDLNQPLPAYLPRFDIIFYLDLMKVTDENSQLTQTALSPALNNIASSVKEDSEIFVFAPVAFNIKHLDGI